MADSELGRELAGIYTTVRRAFAEYDLEKARPHLSLPEGAPLPPRSQVRALLEFLPDLDRSRFLEVERAGDWAGYYVQSELEDESRTSVTVIRFTRSGQVWRLAPPPHTIGSYSTDALDRAGIEQLIAEQDSLRVVPEEGEDPVEAAPDPAPGAAEDDRPDREVRAEIEESWAGFRAAFLRGDVEAAKEFLDLREAPPLPSPEEAREFAAWIPDPERCRFLKLGWHPRKPWLVGYYAEAGLEDPDRSTVVLIVFVRGEDGRWRFSPGPGSIEKAEFEKSDSATLLGLIDTDYRLRL